MIIDFINPIIYDSVGEYGSKFQTALPFKQVIIDDFFGSENARKLMEEFPRHPNPASLVNEFGDPNPKCAISDVRGLGGCMRSWIDLYKRRASYNLWSA